MHWHWAGGTPPGEAKHDTWIMAQIFQRLKALYEKEGGPLPEPILKLDWRVMRIRTSLSPKNWLSEINGYVVDDVADPDQAGNPRLQKGKQLVSFAALRDDGKTACGCWIYSGCYNEAGNNMARRDNRDPDDTGAFPQLGLVLAT